MGVAILPSAFLCLFVTTEQGFGHFTKVTLKNSST